MAKILVTGATGQIGSELVPRLREIYGNENVIAAGHKRKPSEDLLKGPFIYLDTANKEQLEKVIKEHNIAVIYHLVSILSAAGEENPDLAWNVNMDGLKNVLDLAKERKLRVFWPSSIAVFGPTTPKKAPQDTILQPTTMYGITKVAGELLCQYYVKKYGVDVRGLRFPGIISYKTLPGGGTTDYAVAIFFEALKSKKYVCFVSADTILPMMYMPDCIESVIKLMQADKSKLKHCCYNVAAMSFSAKELADEIKKRIPEFECEYKPDFRQKIADSWPKWIDDSAARADWNWKEDFDLPRMTKDMLDKLKEVLF